MYFLVPLRHQKPWGTAHANLAAAETIAGPFGIINADDFNGANSFHLLAEHLCSGPQDYAMVGLILRNTLSQYGSVARGICRVTGQAYLQLVTETSENEISGTAAKYTDKQGMVRSLNGEAVVSVNLWGLILSLFDHLRQQFAEFLTSHGHEANAEFYIPAVVNVLVRAGLERCRVLRTTDSWFGMTYREDRPRVVENIRARVGRGDYPEKLWT